VFIYLTLQKNISLVLVLRINASLSIGIVKKVVLTLLIHVCIIKAQIWQSPTPVVDGGGVVLGEVMSGRGLCELMSYLLHNHCTFEFIYERYYRVSTSVRLQQVVFGKLI